MKDIDIIIARLIVDAQLASDAGKHRRQVFGLPARAYSAPEHYKYGKKPEYILNAVKILRGAKRSHFKYYVTRDVMNGFVLVYFSTTINGEVYQVSFHDPRPSNELVKLIGSGTAMEWDHGSSWYSCRKIAEYYNLWR